MTVEKEWATAASQIKWKQTGQEIRARGIVETWISDAKIKSFGQERVRDLYAELGIVLSLDVRQIHFQADIIKPTRLTKSQGLIRKRIRAGEVLNVVETIVGIDG